MDKSSESPSWLELQRALSLREVEALTGIHRDTIRRRHRDKLVQLSPRRCGMKLRDVLTIVNGERESA